jgi:hypothetical protein
MKQVTPLQILGTPESTDREIPSPSGLGNARVYQDGSVLCLSTGRFYAPEASNLDDSELSAMRKAFDQRLGITISDRLGILTRLPDRF